MSVKIIPFIITALAAIGIGFFVGSYYTSPRGEISTTPNTVFVDKRLQGKVTLVTGAAQGIGKAIAETFAREGAIVVIADISDDLGKAVAQAIGGTYYHLDVSKENEWQAVLDDIIKKYGELHVLVNNAGILGSGQQDPENLSYENWKKIMSINADSCFLGCKYAIKAMKPGTACSIINMSSRSGIVGIPGAAAYAASKAAIRNHTKTVALHCCQQGYDIRCNSVHPAVIMTGLWDPMLGKGKEREAAIKAMSNAIPMKRMGTPQEVANAVLFLASDESSYMTGTELSVDGGILAGTCASPKSK